MNPSIAHNLHAIQSTLAQLQQVVATLPGAQQALLQAPLTQLALQYQQMRDHVADGLYALTDNDSGLQGLMELLQLAQSHSLPACHLAGLLAPLQQQIRHSVADLCEVI